MLLVPSRNLARLTLTLTLASTSSSPRIHNRLTFLAASPIPFRARIRMSTQVDSSAVKPVATSTPSPSPSAVKSQATTSDPAPTPLEFQSVHPAVYIYRPAPTCHTPSVSKDADSSNALRPLSLSSSSGQSTSATSGPPRTVLICGWMNASLRHVSKYATPWSILLPEATIIVLLSRSGDYFTSASSRAQPIEKVLELLEEEAKREGQRMGLGKMAARLDRAAVSMRKDVQQSVSATNGREDEVTLSEEREKEEMRKVAHGMIIHSFSDGGSGNLSLLLSMLKRRSSSTIPSVRANIFDSSPSRMSPTAGSIAFTVPLMAQRRYLLAHTTRILLFLLLFLGKWFKKLTGRKTMSEIMRHRLNDASSWKSGKGQTHSEEGEGENTFPPRLYLYSKADPLIPFEDVEAHAKDLIRIRIPSHSFSSVVPPNPHPSPIDMESSTPDLSSLSKRMEKEKNGVVLCRWERADHCAIARHDFEAYWNAVRSFLEPRLQ